MISILFASAGWTDTPYVAGEIVEPKRTLPIAIVWGTWLVIAVYVLTNVAYFHVLGAEGVARYEAVGSETLLRLAGQWGARALAVLVAVSTFGTINGAILTGPRVTQAMAADGLLWKPLARLDPARATPALALWIQALLSCVWLWCASGFEEARVNGATAMRYFAAPALYDRIYASFTGDIAYHVELARHARGPVLEVGCGNGRVLIPCAAAGAAMDGLDCDPEMLEDARRK